MKISTVPLIVFILITPKLMLAQNYGYQSAIHKYWTCAISSYNSMVNGKYQDGRCQANTEYSAAPCREFVVDHDGEKGVQSSIPYRESTSMESLDGVSKTVIPTIITIEINKEGGSKYLYHYSIIQTQGTNTNKWVYSGLCHYNEAPASEKIYMDYGLKIAR